MNESTPHILLLEPYYGGSHRSFLSGMQQYMPYRFTLVSLPARKWKMRMQLAAPWMVDKTVELIEQGKRFDAILCSTFIDVATLRALLSQAGIQLPIGVYFHENQFDYPNQLNDPTIFQFTALNFTSALAADSLAFNSKYNLDTFLTGVRKYLSKATDMNIVHKVDELYEKSTGLYPGMDFSDFDSQQQVKKNGVPVIVWNHRWEHDKDPETFFQALFRLSEEGVDFKLIVLGQHFERRPTIFSRAEDELKKHIAHFGYVQDKLEYIRLLRQGDIVVSTAVHEFFGMAVLEAVRCGCCPLVPDRLSYREIIPDKYRYRDSDFGNVLKSVVYQSSRLEEKEVKALTEKYSWPVILPKYEKWFSALLGKK